MKRRAISQLGRTENARNQNMRYLWENLIKWDESQSHYGEVPTSVLNCLNEILMYIYEVTDKLSESALIMAVYTIETFIEYEDIVLDIVGDRKCFTHMSGQPPETSISNNKDFLIATFIEYEEITLDIVGDRKCFTPVSGQSSATDQDTNRNKVAIRWARKKITVVLQR